MPAKTFEFPVAAKLPDRRALTGRAGQVWARALLQAHRFEIVRENFRPARIYAGAGEIDFFCARDGHYHVIELKTHRQFEGQVLLSDVQRRRIHQTTKILRDLLGIPKCQKIFIWLLWINWVERRVEFVENP